MKRIVLTGGGTAGHVTPNIALIPELKRQGWEIHYIGTKNGIEYSLISKHSDVIYHAVQSGKLRRYLDIKNFTDPFKVAYGIGQSLHIIQKIKPNVIFSKGGFVSVPVVIGGWVNRIPVIVHESDITPGLANKIASLFAQVICTTFPETVSEFKGNKAVYTGTPIRKELFQGNIETGRKLCGFTQEKPVIMVMGGSSGSLAINNCLRKIVKKLLTRFQIVHICGRGNIDPSFAGIPGYVQFEYLDKELPHIMALADIVVSRAGSNSIHEFLALKKPCLLIPLPLGASRGDQILNAKSFEKKGYSKVLLQEDMTEDSLYLSILDLYNKRHQYIKAMSTEDHTSGTKNVLEVINKYA
ncbi:UDP-N-acetylglucosamine--N-acetylmuramyl-(pentapeptide) pyrophosphoryl-undecaprenol N-acetylglucosamine transferase [Caldicoprobacter guelmensis]|uniref:undecaprenyldiphospho-muramoylpentapeptide beta-N-acetylglucosaminyltransferase n=1 Tax=Caldicoprobacter guelmensis TaxID=1170224 RepID=UPI00195C9CFA|nr:undecaprenyldiphospho-muramoylpentapeptide beta-N-acetylglucosaminyltransferase [Caldicoprobacter guelmensis]MBM7583280.1 UDP-N-acetylglucosamine--N-acetylmuramyl-(pentapeptide) pyrophosphoryl-undecaprenol N-acetylglucosamine transferase [Caldicoprobacter guelmensis]